MTFPPIKLAHLTICANFCQVIKKKTQHKFIPNVFGLDDSLQSDYYPAGKGEDSQREQEDLGSPAHHMS